MRKILTYTALIKTGVVTKMKVLKYSAYEKNVNSMGH